ncbi:hypothetical protein NEUTE2DRAFT_59242 [Neurospora tetrasperma FGSC 2509]|nr:hypothetical protein NEUTE2DRAFT_59242 [Neurospora tetrasperma FGSC 2509]
MLVVLKKRNLAGKNAIYNIRCHQLHGPTILGFWVYVGNGVGVRRVTPRKRREVQ